MRSTTNSDVSDDGNSQNRVEKIDWTFVDCTDSREPLFEIRIEGNRQHFQDRDNLGIRDILINDPDDVPQILINAMQELESG